MEAKAVHFGLFLGATGNHRTSLVVDVEHELGGLLARVTKQFLEDPRHIRHQIDRVIPYDHKPRAVDLFGGGG